MYELRKTNFGNLEVLTVTSGKYKENTYIVTPQSSNESVIIDPGIDFSLLTKVLLDNKLIPCITLLTHGHFDHITCAEQIINHYGVECLVHNLESKLIRQAGFYAYRFLKQRLIVPRNLTFFNHPHPINWAGGSINIIHTPGHTSGSITYSFNGIALFTGDTLFNSFIGPSSYPESNYQDLISSVSNILHSHPDTAQMFPGHGDIWSVKDAKKWWALNNQDPPTFKLFTN